VIVHGALRDLPIATMEDTCGGANTRLVAAAPDLLAACLAFAGATSGQLDDTEADVWAQLHAALAKATGETWPKAEP
jgi:hypothetical protein